LQILLRQDLAVLCGLAVGIIRAHHGNVIHGNVIHSNCLRVHVGGVQCLSDGAGGRS